MKKLEEVETECIDNFSARVISQQGDVYFLLTEKGVIESKVMGKFKHHTKQSKDFPVVGDYVIAKRVDENSPYKILKIMERKNLFSRKMPISGGRKMYKGHIDGGTTEEQIIAANIDYVMILASLEGEISIGRLERYIILAKRSGLKIVIVLTKLDLCNDYKDNLEKVRQIARNIEIVCVSAITGENIEVLLNYIQAKKTVLLLGSSGVGKSTLLNAIFGQTLQKTNDVSESTGKGKHTTTHREMFIHSSGCMIIDSPGIKELQLWAEKEDLKLIYEDIVDLEEQCKYRNCNHGNETGCAINKALEDGVLSNDRWIRYQKVLYEVKRLEERKNEYNSKMKRRGDK